MRSNLVKRAIRKFVKRKIRVDELIKGKHVTIDDDVRINAKRLILGDGVTIKSGTIIEHTDTLIISDYTVIKNNCFISGTNWCYIGPNCWFGHFSVIDSIGTTEILGNTGAGAHSQLWSHIYFGDTLYGSRFAKENPLRIGYDVWFVGHCIVSPIKAGDRSMALVGSVVTKNMEPNHIYSGVPAVDITDKIGGQFKEKNPDLIKEEFDKILFEACQKLKINKDQFLIVDKIDPELNKTQFDLINRVYFKTNKEHESRLIKYLLPTKAKFIPMRQTDWVMNYKESLCSPT